MDRALGSYLDYLSLNVTDISAPIVDKTRLPSIM